MLTQDGTARTMTAQQLTLLYTKKEMNCDKPKKNRMTHSQFIAKNSKLALSQKPLGKNTL